MIENEKIIAENTNIVQQETTENQFQQSNLIEIEEKKDEPEESLQQEQITEEKEKSEESEELEESEPIYDSNGNDEIETNFPFVKLGNNRRTEEKTLLLKSIDRPSLPSPDKSSSNTQSSSIFRRSDQRINQRTDIQPAPSTIENITEKRLKSINPSIPTSEKPIRLRKSELNYSEKHPLDNFKEERYATKAEAYLSGYIAGTQAARRKL